MLSVMVSVDACMVSVRRLWNRADYAIHRGIPLFLPTSRNS
jgi:hypothetical protein